MKKLWLTLLADHEKIMAYFARRLCFFRILQSGSGYGNQPDCPQLLVGGHEEP